MYKFFFGCSYSDLSAKMAMNPPEFCEPDMQAQDTAVRALISGFLTPESGLCNDGCKDVFDGLIKALIPLLATSFTGGYSDAFNEILDDNQIASSIGDVRSCVCSAAFEVPGLVYEVFGLSFTAPDSLPGQTPPPGTLGASL